LEAPQQRLNTSVRASIAANAKPVQITTGPSPFAHAPAGSTMPHFTNSLSPALLSPDTRALAQSIIAQQLQEQMSPNHGLPEVGKVGTAGKILGGAALGSSILGTLPSILKDVRGIGNNPSGINVTGNYNAGDYVGVNPDTGLYDPNYDPSASQIPEVPIDWSGVGSDTGGNF
jgi:hypothetical protein